MEGLNNKWMATVAGIWIQSSCGLYTFAIYSQVLKSSQGYDQSTLETLSVFRTLGSIGVLAGVLYSAVTFRSRSRSSHWSLGGPWVVHLVGAIQNFVGYFLIWASVVGLIHRPPVPLMCFFLFLAEHAEAFFTTTNVVCGVQNFAYCKGTIVGIMKGFVGLSGAIMIQVYDTFCKGNPSAVLLMLALWPTAVTLVLMLLVRIHKGNASDDRKHLNGFTAVALIIAVYLMIVVILDNIFSLPSWARIFTFILLLLLLASPLGIAIKAQKDSMKVSENFSVSDSSAALNPQAYHELAGGEDQVLHDEEGMNPFQAMCTLKFWLLFVAMVGGMGTGVSVINNFSQIGESLNYGTVEINSLVSLWSIWSFFGRIGAGYLSDLLLHTKGCARPFLMAITLAGMAAGQFLIAFGFPGMLYVGSIVVGICYGSQWSLMPAIAADIFGVRHMGTIINAIGIATPLGSYVFSVRIIAYFYEKEASGEDDSCYGTYCFMPSFLIMAAMAFLGCLAAIALLFRTKSSYQLLVRTRESIL